MSTETKATDRPTEEIPANLVTNKDGNLSVTADALADVLKYSHRIGSEPYKHDITQVTALLLFGGGFYEFTYFRSYNHGVSEDAGNYGDIALCRVEPIEVMEVKWRRSPATEAAR